MPLQYPNGEYGVVMKRVAWERLKATPLFQGASLHRERDGLVFLGISSWDQFSRIESAVELRHNVARMRGESIDSETAFDELADIVARSND